MEKGVGLWQIAEAGAHDGRLAMDILEALRRTRSDLFESMEYWISEPSEARRRWQAERLSEFSPRVHWADDLHLGEEKVFKIIFSNELLDAMPVHRLGWDKKRGVWFEWGVALESGKLTWQRLDGLEKEEAIKANLEALPRGLLEVLPDGFVVEISPMAERFYNRAARGLGEGKLVTVDYGLDSEEFVMPERQNGTLRAYYKHRVSNDVLMRPGQQDITAHVNFGRLQAIGEAAGLATECFVCQDKFLIEIAARAWKQDAGSWPAQKVRQFQTLTHPEQLGRKFRVLVQSRRLFSRAERESSAKGG